MIYSNSLSFSEVLLFINIRHKGNRALLFADSFPSAYNSQGLDQTETEDQELDLGFHMVGKHSSS